MMDAVTFYLWAYVAFKTFQVQTTYLPGKRLVVYVVPGVIDRWRHEENPQGRSEKRTTQQPERV